MLKYYITMWSCKILLYRALGLLPVRWGHVAVTNGRQQVILMGGMDGQPVDSINILHNANSLCSLARTLSHCQIISDCIACINMTDSSLIACCPEANFSSETCQHQGGKPGENLLANSTINTNCASFTTCDACWRTDQARHLGCVWCVCENSSTCIPSSDCSCNHGNGSSLELCLLDACRYPSCENCLDDSSCSWLQHGINNATSVEDEFLEAGCYLTNITTELNTSTSIGTCPVPCNSWRSCGECVVSDSPLVGVSTCVWSTSSDVCMSQHNVPLLCAGGKCGAMATSPSQCLPTCAQRLSCQHCQTLPQCRWRAGGPGLDECVDIADSGQVQIENVPECPSCARSCSEHGHCLPTGHCECDLGYVGETCDVLCECNGHSYCANATEEGRKVCVQCQHNRQVRS